MLVLMSDPDSHPLVEQMVTSSVVRSVSRDSKMRQQIIADAEFAWKATESGLVFDSGFRVPFDSVRFCRPIDKIVRGLFYHKSQFPLPATHKVEVYPGNGFSKSEDFQVYLDTMSAFVEAGAVLPMQIFDSTICDNCCKDLALKKDSRKSPHISPVRHFREDKPPAATATTRNRIKFDRSGRSFFATNGRGDVMLNHEIVIYRNDEDSAFVAEVPELPGCAAHGPSYETALAHVNEAMQLWIDTANEFGDAVPAPKGHRLMLA